MVDFIGDFRSPLVPSNSIGIERLLKGISSTSKLSHSQSHEKPDSPKATPKAEPKSKSKKRKAKHNMPTQGSEGSNGGSQGLASTAQTVASADTDTSQAFAWNPNHPNLYRGPIKSWVYDMHGHADLVYELSFRQRTITR